MRSLEGSSVQREAVMLMRARLAKIGPRITTPLCGYEVIGVSGLGAACAGGSSERRAWVWPQGLQEGDRGE